jgi:hypothetical protein
MRLANFFGVAALSIGLALAGCSQTYVDDSVNRGGNGGVDNYPAGPYGYAVGATISNINFVGKMDPAGPSGTADYSAMPMQQIKLSDFYGKAGTKMIVIGGVAGWCVYCNEEQPEMNRMFATYYPQGVQFMLGLSQSFATRAEDIGPATESDLNRWAAKHHTHMPIGLDPNEQLMQFSADVGSWPLTIIIDASNMQIIDYFTGAQTAKLERIIKNFLAQ